MWLLVETNHFQWLKVSQSDNQFFFARIFILRYYFDNISYENGWNTTDQQKCHSSEMQSIYLCSWLVRWSIQYFQLKLKLAATTKNLCNREIFKRWMWWLKEKKRDKRKKPISRYIQSVWDILKQATTNVCRRL